MALPLPAQDADLVVLARRGRDDAFGALYEKYFPGVYDFLTRLLRDRQEAADVTQDTFIKAFERLGHLKRPESFKSWLFTIAHRNGLNRIERSKRAVAIGDFYVSEREVDDLSVVDPDRAGDPERSAEAQAAARIIWEAAAGLDPRTYSVMDLHVRQGLDSAEIAEVLGVSKGNAYTMVSRMKKSFSETLSTYLLIRKGSGDCAELASIIAAKSGTGLTPELRRAADRHARDCDVCEENRKVLFMPIKIFAALGAVPASAGLKAAIWGSVQTAGLGAAVAAGAAKAEAGAASGAGGASPAAASSASGAGSLAAAGQWLQSNLGGLAAAAVLIALLFVGGAVLLNNRDDGVEPEVLSGGVAAETTEAPSPTPAATNAPSTSSAETAAPTTTGVPSSTVTTTSQPPPSTTATPGTTTSPPTTAPPPPPTTTLAPPTTTLAPPPPLVVRGDSATLEEDSSIVIDVLANDVGYSPDATPVVATAPRHGTARQSGKSIAYIPEANFAGIDRLAYSIRGRDGSTREAQVTITVTPVNDAPSVPGPGELAIAEDSVAQFDPLQDAVDVDGDDLAMTRFDATSANGGTVTEGSLIYTPPANWFGMDSFTYTVSDGTVDVVVTVAVAVAAVNDLPTGPDPVIEAVEDQTASGNVLDGWTDVDGDRIFIDDPGARSTAQGGVASVGASGATTYTPPAEFSGTDTFSIAVSDGTATLAVAVVVNVAAANDPPVVANQTFTTAESTDVGTNLGTLVASDPEGDPVRFEQLSLAVFQVQSDGDVVLIDPLDFETAARHQVQARAIDAGGAATEFTITLVVTDVDEAPIVSPATWTVNAGAGAGTVVGTVDATDPEGASLNFWLTGGSGYLEIDAASGVVTLAVDAAAATFPISATAFAADPGGNQGGAAITVNLADGAGPDIASFGRDVDSVFAPSPGRGDCPFEPNRVVFAAQVRDPSGVAAADLHWRITIAGVEFTGTASMAALPGDWYRIEYSISPDLVVEDMTTLFAKVVARDNNNNVSESAELAVTVLPCDAG